ncbi:MAG TPA: hypothetical protein VER39_13555 [Nocardioidaceae bacterium]|nr:hypothetical protein [Nocardioidaceae bacterium]
MRGHTGGPAVLVDRHPGALVIPVLVTLLGIVLLAGLVVVYVAFPHRGRQVPSAPWLGRVLRKGVSMLPTLDNRRSARPEDEHMRLELHR